MAVGGLMSKTKIIIQSIGILVSFILLIVGFSIYQHGTQFIQTEYYEYYEINQNIANMFIIPALIIIVILIIFFIIERIKNRNNLQTNIIPKNNSKEEIKENIPQQNNNDNYLIKNNYFDSPRLQTLSAIEYVPYYSIARKNNINNPTNNGNFYYDDGIYLHHGFDNWKILNQHRDNPNINDFQKKLFSSIELIKPLEEYEAEKIRDILPKIDDSKIFEIATLLAQTDKDNTKRNYILIILDNGFIMVDRENFSYNYSRWNDIIGYRVSFNKNTDGSNIGINLLEIKTNNKSTSFIINNDKILSSILFDIGTKLNLGIYEI